MSSVVEATQSLANSFSTSMPAPGAMNTPKLDIDGMPLRGPGMTINLKLILGHTPQVDDDDDDDDKSDVTISPGKRGHNKLNRHPTIDFTPDDDEFEFVDEEDDDVERKNRKLQRRSSLKTLRSDPARSPDPMDQTPGSPGTKKAVRFADAIGLSLEVVRALLNSDEPPDIPPSALSDLNIRRKHSKAEGKFTLAMDFPQGGSEPDFITRVRNEFVVLENCITSDYELTVSALVRVANISCEKRVDVRYTTDSWKTQCEIPARYVPNSNDGISDRFMFALRLPHAFGLSDNAASGKTSRVEFAICLDVGDGRVYWDNNRGNNYVINCAPCGPISAESANPVNTKL